MKKIFFFALILIIFGSPTVAKTNSKNEKSGKTIQPEMVQVQGGSFNMGSNDYNAQEQEKPAHPVTLNSFSIGKYEVTQSQYQAVMGYNPSTFKGDQRLRKAEKLPVETVSWNEAIAFCNKLNQMLGLPEAYDRDGRIINFTSYRLPTEAEWEFAARGGKNSKGYKYSGSNNPEEVAWYEGNSGSTSQIIGSKKANELGIHDLSGNVLEWVSDLYDAGYYGQSAKKNPYNSFSGSNRVDRGGSWIDDIGNLRVSFRDSGSPGSRYSLLGFRLARSLPEKIKRKK